jgi:hypothetical protein
MLDCVRVVGDLAAGIFFCAGVLLHAAYLVSLLQSDLDLIRRHTSNRNFKRSVFRVEVYVESHLPIRDLAISVMVMFSSATALSSTKSGIWVRVLLLSAGLGL